MERRKEFLLHKGQVKLLEIKDSDIRLSILQQCCDAADKSLHMGGAFSSVIPLLSLFYGGIIQLDVTNPTQRGHDMFVLSKGHSVASMASIFADIGYFDRSVLVNSRSRESILNGHPGPLLPGVHISTGPLGEGMGVAQGLALVGKLNPNFDVFCVTGDGELQEGSIWEAAMYSGFRNLDNLCVMVDQNSGQSDDTSNLVLPLPELAANFTSFGWRVFDVDATQYSPVLEALREFKFGNRNGRPTVLICRTRKGFGAFSSYMSSHKGEILEPLMTQERTLQELRRSDRITEFIGFFNSFDSKDGSVRHEILSEAKQMNLEIVIDKGRATDVQPIFITVKTKRAPRRDKKIKYDASALPKLDKTREYSAQNVIEMCMRVFASDPRVVSIDSDLGGTSNLYKGVGWADVDRGLDVGIAESNMMNVAEAFAAMGYNSWASTFCPFWDWRVMRRIAIGYQERMETIAAKDGWLSDGHGLDITFLATAPDFESKNNGATHMGNDDIQIFNGIAHLKIINISCPNQLIGVMQWIMDGNKGLIYMRIMRAASGVIYDENYKFEYGKAYVLKKSPQDKAVIISSLRGVHESLAAARELDKSGIKVSVVDMPSIDESFLLKLYDSNQLIVIAEQNNGYIWPEFKKLLFKNRKQIDNTNLLAINTLDKEGGPQFIHSANYPQLLDEFGLTPGQIAETIKNRLKKR